MARLRSRTTGKSDIGDVIFEFTPVGAQVRVAAVHVETGEESIIIAPATATQHMMCRIAQQKLARKLQSAKK